MLDRASMNAATALREIAKAIWERRLPGIDRSHTVLELGAADERSSSQDRWTKRDSRTRARGMLHYACRRSRL